MHLRIAVWSKTDVTFLELMSSKYGLSDGGTKSGTRIKREKTFNYFGKFYINFLKATTVNSKNNAIMDKILG